MKNKQLNLFKFTIIVIICSVAAFQDTLLGLNNIQNIVNEKKAENQNLEGTNGTEGFFLSPHALRGQIQVSQALIAIGPNMTVSKTIYNHSANAYTIDNFTIQLQYNDGKQVVDIPVNEVVSVSGGTVFFGYRFNYTVSGPGRSVSGFGQGSIYSDSLNYTKNYIVNSASEIEWALARNNGYTNLTMSKNRMSIKRIQPFNQTDLDALSDMLDRAFQNISPSNVESQILDKFNTIFPRALNDSLNHQAFSKKIQYSYPHPTKGYLNMTIVRYLWEFSITKDDGYRVLYVTEIDGHEKETTCKQTVQTSHSDFATYGGVQNIQLNCLYQDVVNFMQAQGWLDTQLNSNWEVNAFQFYAGDLFDFMSSNFNSKVKPVSVLEGQCKASTRNLILKAAAQIDSNSFSLTVQYNCSLKTTSKTADQLDILQFIAQTKFFIRAYADKLALNFDLQQADVLSLSFTPVNDFIVTNMNLALFKANQVIQKYLKSKLFGSGFPSIPRGFPKTRVDKNYTIYYDGSAFEQYTLDQRVPIITTF